MRLALFWTYEVRRLKRFSQVAVDDLIWNIMIQCDYGTDERRRHPAEIGLHMSKGLFFGQTFLQGVWRTDMASFHLFGKLKTDLAEPNMDMDPGQQICRFVEYFTA